MAKKKAVYTSFVLDESSSMASHLEATISGFNEYLDSLKKQNPNDLFTLIKFNTNGVTELCVGVKVKDAPALSRANYHPDSMTPLYDAIGRAIYAAEKAAGDHPVLIVIQTDGQENSSVEFNRQQIFDLVTKKKAAGWAFMFLGADIDAYGAGAQMAMDASNVLNYTGKDAREAFHRAASGAVAYSRSAGTKVKGLISDQQ